MNRRGFIKGLVSALIAIPLAAKIAQFQPEQPPKLATKTRLPYEEVLKLQALAHMEAMERAFFFGPE